MGSFDNLFKKADTPPSVSQPTTSRFGNVFGGERNLPQLPEEKKVRLPFGGVYSKGPITKESKAEARRFDATEVRGGSFEDTLKEIDHIIPVALGGTRDPENLQPLSDKKTLVQKFQSLFGKKFKVSDFKDENRQVEKATVAKEKEIIKRYQNDDITLKEARLEIIAFQLKPEKTKDFFFESLKETIQKPFDFFKTPELPEKKEGIEIELGDEKITQDLSKLSFDIPREGGVKTTTPTVTTTPPQVQRQYEIIKKTLRDTLSFAKSITIDPIVETTKPALEIIGKGLEKVKPGFQPKDDRLFKELNTPEKLKAFGEEFVSQTSEAFQSAGGGFLKAYSSGLGYLERFGWDEAKPLKDKLNDWAKQVEPENPDFADTLFSGISSMASMFLPGTIIGRGIAFFSGISPKIANLVGNSVMTLIESMMEAGGVYDENIKKGMDEKTARRNADIDFGINVILLALTNKFDFTGKVQGNLVTELKKRLFAGARESFQETGQQVAGNIATGKEWNEGLKDSSIISGLMGFFLGGSITSNSSIPIKVQEEIKDLIEDVKVRIETKPPRLEQLEQPKKFDGLFIPESITEAPVTSKTAQIEPKVAGEIEQKAIKIFGITDVPESASFVTKDGRFIDSSGQKQGAFGEGRNIDHREIAVESVSEKLQEGKDATDTLSIFMNETGNVRISVFDDSINIDVIQKPTDFQLNSLEELSEGKTIFADISRLDGSVVSSGEFKNFSEYREFINKSTDIFNKAKPTQKKTEPTLESPALTAIKESEVKVEVTKEPTKKTFSTHYEKIKKEFGFEEKGVEIDKITLKEQAKKAFDYIQKNPEKAMRIAYGMENSPLGIKDQAIRQSLIVSLKEAGKIEQAQEIARITSEKFTDIAQQLNLAKQDLGKDIKITKNITQARLEKIGEKLGAKPEESIKAAEKKIKTESKKASKDVKEKTKSELSKTTLKEIDNLINSIIC